MSDLRKRKLAAMALSTLLTNIDFVSNFMDTAALILSAAIGVSVDERAGDVRVKLLVIEMDQRMSYIVLIYRAHSIELDQIQKII